jgi:integrase
MATIESSRTSGGALVVQERAGGPVFCAKWRDAETGRQVKRALGPAWVVREGDPHAKPRGERFGGWIERRGRETSAPAGTLTWRAALRRLDEVRAEAVLVASHEPGRARAARLREQARALELEARRLEGENLVTFGQAADAWLTHRRDVKRVKPSTLQNHRYDLRSRILPRWGDVPLVAIEPADIVTWRDETAAGRTLKKNARPLNPRTINKTMIVFSAVLRFACRPESLGGFGLPSNPAAFVEKLRENDRAPVDYFEPDEIVAIAAALRAGRHRTDRMPAGGEHALDVHRSARALEDLRDAAVVLTAGFAGLRRGELVGLQWADVDFANERLLVRRSYVLSELTSTKGRQEREVPLARQLVVMLDGLEQARQAHTLLAGVPAWVSAEDFVFGSLLGSPMDASAFLRRFKRARDSLGLRALALHSLRHSFVSMAREGFSVDAVRAMAGHKDHRTAQGYAHAKSRAGDAARLSERFTSELFSPELAAAASAVA